MQKILLTSSPGDPVSPASPTGPLDPCGKKNNNNNNPLNWTVGSSEIYRMYMIYSHRQLNLRVLFPVTCWPATPGAPTVPLSPRAPCSNKRRTTMSLFQFMIVLYAELSLVSGFEQKWWRQTSPHYSCCFCTYKIYSNKPSVPRVLPLPVLQHLQVFPTR